MREAHAHASAATTVWVARHGERADVDPEWERQATRPHDPPLTELGRAQATATAVALADVRPRVEIVYASPFLRCVETACIIAERLGCRVRIEPGLCELLLPRWFGTSNPVDANMSATALRAFACARHEAGILDESYAAVFDTPERAHAAPDGRRLLAFPETPLEAADRYTATFAALQATAACSLLVTHGFGVQAIAETVGGAEVIECDYCALTRLDRAPAAPDASGDAAAGWTCSIVCQSSHTEGAAAAASGAGGGEVSFVELLVRAVGAGAGALLGAADLCHVSACCAGQIRARSIAISTSSSTSRWAAARRRL